jgi:hypothetical protein
MLFVNVGVVVVVVATLFSFCSTEEYIDLTHPVANGFTLSWPWFDSFQLIIKFDPNIENVGNKNIKIRIFLRKAFMLQI